MIFNRFTILFIPCLFILFGNSNIFGQQKTYLMLNSKKIEDGRYKDVNGSPYLFDDWKYGKTMNSKAELVDSILINYNGLTNNMEVMKNNVYIELDAYHYPLVVVYGDLPGEEIFFRRSANKTLLNRYPRMIYNGLEIAIVEDFISRIDTKKVNDVGKIRESSTFVNRKNYYFIKDNNAKLFKLNQKSIIKLLGHKEALEEFVKQEKLKFNDESDLIKLLEFYEKSGFNDQQIKN